MKIANFFATKLKADIDATTTTIGIDTMPKDKDGNVITAGILVLEARKSDKHEIIEYTGVDATNLTGCLRGQGGTNATTHLKGSLVEMNATGTHLTRLYEAFDTFAATNGDGWLPLVDPLTLVATHGNRSFDLSITGDKRNILSPGMRFKVNRSVAAPTQSADLEKASGQYATNAAPVGLTFTDDFTCEAWVKQEENATGVIIQRLNTTGFQFYINGLGKIVLGAIGSAAKVIESTVSVPVGEWVHVAAFMNMSATAGQTYINGIPVATTFTSNGAATAITQAGDLRIGANQTGGAPFDGQIAEARVWSTIRTETELRDNMYKQLAGSETGLVAYFKLNGNFNDSTANANHLTPVNGAIATFSDNPFKNTEYAIITDVSYSGTDTIFTVFTAGEHGIPNTALNAPHYSTQRAPHGFPTDANRWVIYTRLDSNTNSAVSGYGTVISLSNISIMLPQGRWRLGYDVIVGQQNSTAGIQAWRTSLSTSKTAFIDNNLTKGTIERTSSASLSLVQVATSEYIASTVKTEWFLVFNVEAGAGTVTFHLNADYGRNKLYAECAYL